MNDRPPRRSTSTLAYRPTVRNPSIPTPFNIQQWMAAAKGPCWGSKRAACCRSEHNSFSLLPADSSWLWAAKAARLPPRYWAPREDLRNEFSCLVEIGCINDGEARDLQGGLLVSTRLASVLRGFSPIKSRGVVSSYRPFSIWAGLMLTCIDHDA